jgi:F-type H+-transporting ATPase subunit beta
MALLRKYDSLKSIIAIIGENELSPADRADYAKAKKLIKNFTQNMNVMEKHIGIPGDTFTREQTLDSIEAIINGEDIDEADRAAAKKKKEEAEKAAAAVQTPVQPEPTKKHK